MKENQENLSCIDQLTKLREFYDILASEIRNKLRMSNSTYNYKIRHNTFTHSENTIMQPIIKRHLKKII